MSTDVDEFGWSESDQCYKPRYLGAPNHGDENMNVMTKKLIGYVGDETITELMEGKQHKAAVIFSWSAPAHSRPVYVELRLGHIDEGGFGRVEEVLS